MNKKILLIGGGGHCKSVLDSLIQAEQYSEIGIIDKNENIGKHVLGISIVGCDDDLIKLYRSGYNNAFVTLGSIGDAKHRIKLFSMLEEIGFEIPNIVDSTSIISKDVNMSGGIYVGKNAVVNAGVSIGKGVIINTSSIIEHDCKVESFSHIATGSVLCGEVHVEENVHIGANSVVKQQVKIGANTIIGMGSVVLHDIACSMIAYGNPCKEVKSR
ncbi:MULTISPECIES: acetyltransferase [unclassified Sedimentibacter]|uniref:acetyltransferase n=1 Tax=unclassified Sedimentibacter TaxID=2649220 RepID=UPI0027DF7F05|nr:acetyltransferase [Sedimentibacter sp. MB35-C1]WMJ78644.1 acetyltransferase [Sedimentibacter sp. MB35-C1]